MLLVVIFSSCRHQRCLQNFGFHRADRDPGQTTTEQPLEWTSQGNSELTRGFRHLSPESTQLLLTATGLMAGQEGILPSQPCSCVHNLYPKFIISTLTRWERDVASPQTMAGTRPGPFIIMEIAQMFIKNIVSNHPFWAKPSYLILQVPFEPNRITPFYRCPGVVQSMWSSWTTEHQPEGSWTED